MNDNVGARLKAERQRIGLNQTDAGRLGDASKNTQLSYESGKSSPNADYLLSISKAGFDIFYIVTGQRMEGASTVGEAAATYRVKRYDKPADALMAALAVQDDLGLLFTADQVKALLGYAYTAQASQDQIKLFVQKAFELFGKNGDNDEQEERR